MKTPRTRRSQQGFANELPVATGFLANVALLITLVFAALGHPPAWPLVLILVGVGLPGSLYTLGARGALVLGGVGLLDLFLAGRMGESAPVWVVVVLTVVALLGGIGAVVRRRAHRDEDSGPAR